MAGTSADWVITIDCIRLEHISTVRIYSLQFGRYEQNAIL